MKKEIELEREIIYAQENRQRVRYLYLLIKRYIINIGGNDMKESLRSTISSGTKTFTIQTGQDRSSVEAYITFWYLKD